MIGPVLVAASSVAYLSLLFAIAYWVDRQPEHGRRLIDSSVVYTLSLAVYCTSWTFYGSVGRAARSGADFLTIYLGPTLAFCLGWLLLNKILRVARANRITSIADLIASRFGKSAGLAGLVTVLAVISAVPYLALQIKAVSTSFTLLTGSSSAPGPQYAPIVQDAGLWATALLTLFAMLFGSRSIHPGEHHQGMVAAVAFESLVKLLSLTAVGLFVGFGLFHGFGDLFARAQHDPGIRALFRYEGVARNGDWIAFTLLSFAAIVCLPRQFQVMVVENLDERHLDRALWLFPLYLLAINLFVVPIAIAGRLLLSPGSNPDSFVLTLPLHAGQHGLALAVFIGGFSASAGMIIVAAAALSTMVCNDLVIPILLKLRPRQFTLGRDAIHMLLSIRRAAMAVVMGLGYLYMRYASEESTLVAIGLMSFAGVAQFFPAIVLGLYWRRAARVGAIAGILGGSAVWAYTLVLPSFVRSGSLPQSFIDHGPFGVALLKPYALFGLDGLSPVAHSAFWSLLVNAALLIGISLFARQSAVERAQAAVFVDAFESAKAAQLWRRTAQLPDLMSVVGRFLGHQRAQEMFAAWARRRGRSAAAFEADSELVLYAERLLAGTVGSASARALVGSVVEEELLGIDEVMLILNEASRAIEVNRRLEEKSRALELAGAELRRANERLQELDRLKDDFISTVNHELRTPLTSIRSFAEILLDNPDLEAGRREEFQRIILRETERLTRLINQMLDLAKIESGQIAYEMKAVGLAGVLRDAAAAAGQLFRDKGVALEIAAPAGEIVWADRDLLIQVLLNLLSNAVKFCPSGSGRVRLAIESEARSVVILVADNGPGVAPGDRELVFDRFRQGSGTLSGKPPGTGLGLAICRTIVQRLGGEIWIEGAPGEGARLRVRLSRLPEAAMAEGGGTVSPPLRPLAGGEGRGEVG